MGAPTTDRRTVRHDPFVKGLARAFAGAIIFAFPLLMTMEMWWLGFYLDRGRLLLFLVLNLILLVPLSRRVGFEETHSFARDLADALIAFGIGIAASALMLTLFAIITPAMPASEIVGKIAVQAAPASLGALLARGQFGERGEDERSDQGPPTYGEELFLMLVGALFLAFNVAPTDEMALIAFKMTPWHALALVVMTVLALHAFVYAIDFRGEEKLPEDQGGLRGVVAFSVAGYGIAILVSFYVLWTFGRTDGTSPMEIAMMVSVLGFPAALGAGTARLII